MARRNSAKASCARIAVASACVLAACAAFAEGQAAKPKSKTAPKAQAPKLNPDSVVATVGSLRVGRAEFEARYATQTEQYRQRSGSDLAAELVPIARRQVLEGFIQRQLLQLEAERRGIVGTEAEAEEEMKRDPFFSPGGTFSQAKFDAIRSTQPKQFAATLQQIRVAQGGRHLQLQLEKEFTPATSELRVAAERELTRAAVSYFSLPREDFSPDYAEPRETDVLEAYRARRGEFLRPVSGRMTIALINTPAPTDSERASPARLQARIDRLRAQAQTALAAVRGGASLEEATADFGAPRHDIAVARDHFPGYWRGDERLNAMLFALPVGGVLPEPVPVVDGGWLLVRLDERTPAHVAPLEEAAPRIRAELRERARQQADEQVLHPLYERMRDSLRTAGYRVRYALADTSTLKVPEPGAAELERYYRAHLAEYSGFDPATTSVRARPFAEVKTEVRARLMRERRLATASEITATIAAAWSQGKRDRGAESRASALREVGPVVRGAPADTGAVGKAVGDSLAGRAGALGVGIGPSPRGPMVFHVYEAVPGYAPTFEQARPLLAARREAERQRQEEMGARALFDRDPMRFAAGDVIHLTRVSMPPPDVLQVKLARADVERYHQEHIDRYSASETISARHILISPTGPGPEADEKARARAADVLRRLRAGEDFATLARQYSDDAPTRDRGGELGSFTKGVMLEEFEHAAFALKEGEISDLVRTREGYHIIQCLARESAYAQPLSWMYSNVGYDLATERADEINKRRADSLYVVAGTPAKMLAAARKLHLEAIPMEHAVGSRGGLTALVEVLTRLETMKPGEMYPGPHKGQGKDLSFSWVDSITPAGKPAWRDAKSVAILAYRRDASERVVAAKTAELDSLMRRGFGFDSLAALWGGLQSEPELAAGKGLKDLGGQSEVDSLVFAGARPAALAVGQVSGWLRLPLAVVRLRLDRQAGPDASAVEARMAARRRAELERKLRAYFQELKRRYPVKILDPGLAQVGLPEPPAP